jgi:hypothetical protein
MITRELLDNDDWYVSINWLGLGAICITSKLRGVTVKATSGEKSYLMRMMEELQRAGIPLGGDQPVLAQVFDDFAEAVLSARAMGGSSARHAVFFQSLSPEESAKQYLA